jgi:hypothetical protein
MQQKGMGSRQERDRERGRVRCGVWVERVIAWVINLTIV